MQSSTAVLGCAMHLPLVLRPFPHLNGGSFISLIEWISDTRSQGCTAEPNNMPVSRTGSFIWRVSAFIKDGKVMHGKDTYKKIKLDLKAMNEILNTKESEHAPPPPPSSSRVKSPMEQYLTPLSDEETQASYQSWINQLKAKKKQRQLKMLHDSMSLQKDFLPPGLTFEQCWARMKHHSRNPRVLEYLYNQQNHMDHIKHECHITDKRNRIKQKQYMVQWADTYILKRHLPMYLEQGYKVAGVTTCPVLRQCAGRTTRHAVVKATWEPIREPAQNVPKEVMEDFEARKAGLKPLKLAKDNRARPDQGKSNMDKQGFQMPIHDKETSAFLHEPSLARLITIEPNDTVNPDQDIKPMFKYVISMSWKDQCINETMANVYNPSSKLCGSITMHRLRILYSAFKHSQLHQPDTHKQCGHLDFPTAIAHLLNRYTNKASDGSKKSKLANQCTTPDRYMQAFKDGLSVTTERFASPLNFSPKMTCYFSMYAEDALSGANFDAYSVKWTGASQVNPEYEAVAMEKAMRWAILSAEEATEPVLTTFVLPWWDDKGSSYARWLSHQTVQAIATIDRSKFRFNAPRHWADEQDQWCTPKRNVHFLIVANEAGLQHFVKQDKLNKGLACASQLGNPPQRPKQLKMTIQQTVSPPGLYPPKHYCKATNTTATAWSPAEQPTSEEFSQVFHNTELKFRPDEIICTDGSRKEIPGIGLVTGSGIYREHKHAHLSLKVHPYGQGTLNTINRAELVALLIAVRHCRPGVQESIATDSKCSMPTVDDCHRPLLEAIGHEVAQRAQAGDETILLKVKSHIGMHGNEMADKACK